MRTYLLEERAVLHFDRRARPLTINWRQKPTETTVTCVIVMIISRNAAYYFSGHMLVQYEVILFQGVEDFPQAETYNYKRECASSRRHGWAGHW